MFSKIRNGTVIFSAVDNFTVNTNVQKLMAQVKYMEVQCLRHEYIRYKSECIFLTRSLISNVYNLFALKVFIHGISIRIEDFFIDSIKKIPKLYFFKINTIFYV